MSRRDPVPRLVVHSVKRSPVLHRAARHTRWAIGRLVPPRALPGIPGRVHFNDFMLDDRSPEGVASYRERALNVLKQIDATLESAERYEADVESWLDFGCGYGRVTRFLVERVPAERVSVSDVVLEGVEFCASEFGVRPIPVHADLAERRLGSFDFVFAISVLSHLNEWRSKNLLRLLGESLAPGGLLLLTFHGHWSIDHPEHYGSDYGEWRSEIRKSAESHGMCFLPYPYVRGDSYGMAWHTREFIEGLMNVLHGGEVELLRFDPEGLDRHQDVIAFRRRSAGRVQEDLRP